MAENATPGFDELLEMVGDLECAVAELREYIEEALTPRDSNVILMSGLVVYSPDDDHGNVMVVAASSRRHAVISVPPRPTVREWVGIMHHCKQWPSDVPMDRAENLLLRVIDPHLDGVPIDILDVARIEQAISAARLTDDERGTARQLLELAVAEAVLKGKAPAF